MKKYKLIKEYPGSLKLGTVILSDDIEYVGDYPEYWEEVIEKDYEILSFKCGSELMTLRENGRYVVESKEPKECPNGKGATLEEELNYMEEDDYVIHSVKRLTDDEVFTLGDKVNSYIIDVICLSEQGIKIFFQDERLKPYLLKDIISRKPLFTTEDEVEIFEENELVYVVNTLTYGVTRLTFNLWNNKTNVIFKTKEGLNEWLMWNKPTLSLKEVSKQFPVICNPLSGKSFYLKEIAKERS